MDNTDDAEYSNSQLANILSNVYQDVDNLRRELSLAKKRADKAERLLQSFQTIQQSSADVSSSSGQSPDVARLIMDYEDRLSRAERAREDAEARKRAIQEHWPSVERYLTLIERKAHDTRSSFSRVVSEDTSPISLPHLTSYSNSHVFPTLPPHPNPNPGRRHRTPSMDSSLQQPPAKRSRGESHDRDRRYPDHQYPPHPSSNSYEDYRPRREPRMIRPGAAGTHPRSRSHSSDKSISSVDEMLLQATAGESNGTTTNGAQPRRLHNHSQTLHPPNAYPAVGQQQQQTQQQQQQQRAHPDSPPYPTNRPRGSDHPGSLGPATQSQPYLFAPVVTGAPPKKQKYTATSGGGGVVGGGVTPAASANNLGPIETPPVPTPPVAAFPPTNAEGQRICRQCGLPGRYKDGKCVEKWGPGPMGPGTVCDRCRKKMKRVERRGTLEQQLANANANTLGRTGSHVVVAAAAAAAAHQPQPQQPHPPPERGLQRSDTVLTQQSQSQGNNNGGQISFRSVISSTTTSSPGKTGRTMSPPPAIASLKDEDENVSRHSRSSSRNGRPASKQQHQQHQQSPQHLTVPSKRSPLASGSVSGDGKDPSPIGRVEVDGETDADAEAEVDADAEADGDNEEYEIDDDEPPPPRRKGRETVRAVREADEDLLEAVDAAEANSNSSHVGGRRYHEED